MANTDLSHLQVGITNIDNAHLMLLSLIDQLAEATQDSTRIMLMTYLRTECLLHFESEERLLTGDCEIDLLTTHSVEHSNILKDIAVFERDILTAPSQDKIAESISKLRKRFFAHFKHDQKIFSNLR